MRKRERERERERESEKKPKGNSYWIKMSFEKDIIVIIKAKNCSVSRKLDANYRQRLEDGGLEVIEYEVSRMRTNNCVYPDIIGLIEWYPFIIHTSCNNWNDIKNGKDVRHLLNTINALSLIDKLKPIVSVMLLSSSILVQFEDDSSTFLSVMI